MEIHQILSQIFGYQKFRGQQEEIIQTVIKKEDALVIMPTGGGKSLCFQIPALAMQGLTIVVSPLIALMDDQVSALKQNGIAAGTLHSNIDPAESRNIFNAIQNKTLKLLYVSPEKLLSDSFLDYLSSIEVSLFAIDEAHCVSVWGNDFRPEYVRLAKIKQLFPSVPMIALTATADLATQKDIKDQLGLNIEGPFLSSFERKNIYVSSKSGLKRFEQIQSFVSTRQHDAGIVYCLSRKSTEQVAEKLQKIGFNAAAYHAKLSPQIRKKVQEDFQNDDLQIVCATIAFGMGIDKPNIRWVIHYNMPKNIEAYYQEIGRGGRDGKEAEALLFYSWGDFLNLQKFIDQSPSDETFKTVQRAKLERMWQLSTATSCSTNLVLNYFGEFKNEPCNHCDNCSHPAELFDGTLYAQMALSAMIRCKEALGINILIDILRGSYKQEIRSGGYDKIKTFGAGRAIPFNHWRHYIIQMINKGIISIDYSNYSKLKTTPLSNDVLKSNVLIEFSKYIPPEEKKKTKIQKAVIDISDADQSLLKRLKSWRKTMAVKQKVPAFVILKDASLIQIASLKPDNKNKLLSIEGIGKVKLEKYGDDIMEMMN